MCWPIPFEIQLFFFFGLGCCIGSFLSVCIERWGQGRSVISPGSHCPHCKAKIPWYRNIPIYSWLSLRGRTACCHRPIPLRYFISECVLGIVSVGFYAYFRSMYVPYFTLFCLLWIAFFTDIDTMTIPDETTLLGMLLGVTMSYFWSLHRGVVDWEGCVRSLQSICWSMGGLFLFISCVEFIIKKDAMGLGDVKLLGCIGAFLGHQACWVILFTGALLGTFWILTYSGFRRYIKHQDVRLNHQRIPFGPFLAVGALFYLFFPAELGRLFIPSF